MKLHKIRWKQRATRLDKSYCLWIIECEKHGFVVPLRADSTGAFSAYRSNIWLVLL
jgi:hypothetical protein